MNQIFHADYTEFAQVLLDDLVVGERDALPIDLSVTALVDEIADGFETWIAIGDVRFDYFEHFRSGFSDFNEDTIVDLEQTEELNDLAGFRGHFVNASDC